MFIFNLILKDFFFLSEESHLSIDLPTSNISSFDHLWVNEESGLGYPTGSDTQNTDADSLLILSAVWFLWSTTCSSL